jgi:hypothetical protein
MSMHSGGGKNFLKRSFSQLITHPGCVDRPEARKSRPTRLRNLSIGDKGFVLDYFRNLGII